MESKGAVRSSDVSKLPKDLVEILESQNIKSILVFPLYVDGLFFGFMGFDECSENKEWEEDEIELLRTISNMIAGAFERKVSIQKIERLAQVPENDPFMIVEVSLDGEVIYMNPSAKQEQEKGIQIVMDDDKINDEIWSVIKTESPKVSGGMELEVNDHLLQVKVARSEKSDRILLFMNEITEQRRIERQVGELDKLKSRFITALTHVARTPLNEVRWAIESLISGEFGELSEAQLTMMRKALESESEVLQIIDNMNITLDIERGTLHLEKVPTSIISITNSTVTSLEPECEVRNVVCAVQKPTAKYPNVVLDPEKMRLALFMLVDNALKYSKEGSAVKVAFLKSADSVTIKVIDKGIGIPVSEQDNIFDRFFRASNAQSAHPNGIGLGLYISKAIVEEHGGTIGFTSKEGEGSTFWIKLPLKK